MAIKPKPIPVATYENPDDGVLYDQKNKSNTFQAIERIAEVSKGSESVLDSSANPYIAMRESYDINSVNLTRIVPFKGRFHVEEGKADFGDSIELELVSYQQNFVACSGQTFGENKKFDYYSSDGVVAKNEEECREYIKALKKTGFAKATMDKRTMLIGLILNRHRVVKMDESLIRIDLDSASTKNFERFIIRMAFDVGRGELSMREVVNIRLEAKVTNRTSPYTIINFEHNI